MWLRRLQVQLSRWDEIASWKASAALLLGLVPVTGRVPKQNAAVNPLKASNVSSIWQVFLRLIFWRLVKGGVTLLWRLHPQSRRLARVLALCQGLGLPPE